MKNNNNIIAIAGIFSLAFTAVSSAETAVTDTSTTTASEIASDRATFTFENQQLHIPYTQLNDEHNSAYSLDMFLSGLDDSGNLIFLLDPGHLSEIHSPHFSYEGSTGPGQWASLTTDYALCGTGKNQSPVDVVSSELVSASLSAIQFNYSGSAMNVLHNGHAVQVNYDTGSSITLNGKVFNLIQYHFHTPSEHTIDGASYPLEMHLVHISDDGSLAVVGVLFTEGAENTFLNDLVAAMPLTETAVSTVDGVTVNANNLLPSQTVEYRYSGSLTTPPCSEGVNWLVMQNTLEVSTAQLSVFQRALNTNNRPVQSVNARNLLKNVTQ